MKRPTATIILIAVVCVMQSCLASQETAIIASSSASAASASHQTRATDSVVIEMIDQSHAMSQPTRSAQSEPVPLPPTYSPTELEFIGNLYRMQPNECNLCNEQKKSDQLCTLTCCRNKIVCQACLNRLTKPPKCPFCRTERLTYTPQTHQPINLNEQHTAQLTLLQRSNPALVESLMQRFQLVRYQARATQQELITPLLPQQVQQPEDRESIRCMNIAGAVFVLIIITCMIIRYA